MRVKLDACAKIQLKKGVISRFYNCQPNRKRAHAILIRAVVQKLRRTKIQLVQDAFDIQQHSVVAQEPVCPSSSLVDCNSRISDDQDVDGSKLKHLLLRDRLCSPSESTAQLTKDFGIQISLRSHYRSKYVQYNFSKAPEQKDASCTPIQSMLRIRSIPSPTSLSALKTETKYTNILGNTLQSCDKYLPTDDESGESLKRQKGNVELQTLNLQLTRIDAKPKNYIGVPEHELIVLHEIVSVSKAQLENVYLTVEKTKLKLTKRSQFWWMNIEKTCPGENSNCEVDEVYTVNLAHTQSLENNSFRTDGNTSLVEETQDLANANSDLNISLDNIFTTSSLDANANLSIAVKRNFPELVFYGFPKDAEHSTEWIITSTVLDEEKLRNQYLCDLHFHNDSDLKSSHRLTSNAVPKTYDNDKISVLIPSKMYSGNKTCLNDKSQEQNQLLTTSSKSKEWVEEDVHENAADAGPSKALATPLSEASTPYSSNRTLSRNTSRSHSSIRKRKGVPNDFSTSVMKLVFGKHVANKLRGVTSSQNAIA
ncbi:hypothetical protein RN001_001566 [Aquatica leii]|uniref:THAP-type domain-containing protein n=1 Tax=Aquatica leii TaxID=1421715 RepID=A0AAN7PBT1_9COLE|nr:hypothetical protein RN001_001566 [Aquatica leii]